MPPRVLTQAGWQLHVGRSCSRWRGRPSKQTLASAVLLDVVKNERQPSSSDYLKFGFSLGTRGAPVPEQTGSLLSGRLAKLCHLPVKA